ncbi:MULTISPECIES: DNA-primase RepB domain-containing protein [unclassified Desulfovibrio]|uniref:DNA-primase RepB domain-containing protein n=1 Tax=unclassified Desulfovibrio TaxID=2593640 RepID=UPI0013ED05F3|nr:MULTISPECIES: DNA-primase RepB domain-containing protein [unclassified Desulfovibrio]
MIVKKIKYTKNTKPKEWQIGDLVDYIRNPSVRNRGEKIEHAGSRNFLTDTHSAQKLEMIALARETVRSKMPVNHWVFSWPEGEQPTRAQVDELVDIFLEKMGLKEHQAIYGLHCDTRNYHVHIAVNRVHPETLRVVRTNNGFDIWEAHKIKAFIEKKQGWSELANAPFVYTEDGELAERKLLDSSVKPTSRAQDFERATGEKSAQRIAQERGHDLIKNAQSWAELHAGLKGAGLRFEKKGSGAIIWVGEQAVKASSVDRAFSMGKLCKRLGDFVGGDYEDVAPSPAPEPLYPALRPAWEMYRGAVRAEREAKKELEEKVRDEVNRLKEHQAKERREKLARIAKYGVPFLNIGRHCLKLEHVEQLRRLRDRLKASLSHRRVKRFSDWLKTQGLPFHHLHTVTYEATDKTRHTPAPISSEAASLPQAKLFLEYVKAVNADRYRVTAIKMGAKGEKKVMILDKRNGESRGFTPEELLRRMPEIVKLARRGENIYYTPLSEQKHHILLDDMSPEKVMQLQKDGFKPAVFLESSPNNYQCILTFPKFQGDFDREIGNHLAMILNKRYGDPKLSGAVHPHRAPGFENRKPKHQRKDGTFPRVSLSYAVRQECQKALIEARKIEQAFATAKHQREQQANRSTLLATQGAASLHLAYFKHWEDISAHINIKDFSRVDAMIALRLRSNGHSQKEVEETLRACAPAIRERRAGRNWQRYAERTAAYAFGYAGDRDMERHSRYRKLWGRIEGPKEVQKIRCEP